jgi:hypothetical protein
MDMNNEPIQLKPARLGRTLKKGFSDAYDRLGLVIVASIIWSVATLGPMAVAWEVQRRVHTHWLWIIVAGFAASVLIGTPILAGVFRMAYKIVYRDDPALIDIFIGARELFKAGYGLILLNIIIVGVIVTDIAFFFGWFGPLKGSVLAYVTGSIAIYLLLGWLAAAMYQMPILSAQKSLSQKEGAIPAIRKSLLLIMDNPGFTIGLFVVILGFSVLCVLSRVGMLILYVGTVSIVLTRALRELYVRYGMVEDTAESEGQPK